MTSIRLADDFTQEFNELEASIRANGLLHPLIARPSKFSGRYEIVCGRRRYLACKKIGFAEIPCLILELSDREALEYSIVENLQRKNLDPIEEAEAFKRYLVNFGRGGITRLGTKIGKSDEYVSHRLLLLGLPKEVTSRIRRRLLKPSLATELIWVKDPVKQITLADEITKRNLSFKETRIAAKIIREQGMSAEEAADKAIRHVKRECKSSGDELLSGGDVAVDPWVSYNDPGFEGEEFASCKHAILIVRSCLSGLDLLIDKTPDLRVRDMLMQQRKSVHTILDEIIRTSLQYQH
ncbi:MAG: ParB/RepB/Spo0J family partition protein [Nitrososphaerota archaeon]|nr:ParB/RepB/Spo0J family partition protein [Nitrososphaerota archaeon]